ncbi:MAG TPA: lysophospholipid acyltransferase family protein [Bacteroidales bacterium]|nr:lysophospholipid acyltransferase family protein [Bacteroidales bacterium]
MTNTFELQMPERVIFAETLLRFFDYNQLNNTIRRTENDIIRLIDDLMEQIELKYDISPEDLKNIPSEGPFIIISNNPYKGIDSMLLYKIISEKRNDFKIIANHLLHDVESLRNVIIPVNTIETTRTRSSYYGIKTAQNHLREGHCLGIFPAGLESDMNSVSKIVMDHEWQYSAIKMIRKSGVPVIPVYFHGTRIQSNLKRIMNPFANPEELPSELVNRKKRIISVRIGSQISVNEQNQFSEISTFGKYLRSRTYLLGSAFKIKKPVKPVSSKKAEPLVKPVDPVVLNDEVARIKPECELFKNNIYSVLCAPVDKIPYVFAEIGRLREETFRNVGEGTNKSTDTDEYDLYYQHLFIWDNQRSRIVGAYRIGKGKEILYKYGIKGFYINSLFGIDDEFSHVLESSLELGRSFIAIDYQKKALSLFLLWKGIMCFLLKYPEYRYLIGPVSISNDFSELSKTLIVLFSQKYFKDEMYSALIKPKKEFKIDPCSEEDCQILTTITNGSLGRLEKLILDIEKGCTLPVLLKRYLEINGKIVGFNIDPDFNNCLDGLLLLDIYKTPAELIRGLSRELNDPSILKRFDLDTN